MRAWPGFGNARATRKVVQDLRDDLPEPQSGKMGKLLPDTLNGNAQEETVAIAGAFVEGASASMRPVEAVIRELSQSDVPVLLLAEPGAGKHATARRIHEMSRRKGQPFRTLQCSTLKPEELMITPKNGHSAGAGTIFLEELADLSAASQAFLREASYEGRVETERAMCRQDSSAAVRATSKSRSKAGRLREDLYYRISGVCLRLPPSAAAKGRHPAAGGTLFTQVRRGVSPPAARS